MDFIDFGPKNVEKPKRLNQLQQFILRLPYCGWDDVNIFYLFIYLVF